MNATPKFAAGALAAVLLLAAAPMRAHAQDVDSKVVVDPDETPSAKALDRRFRDVLNRMPDSKESNDPWGSVRAAESTKPKAKDEKKQPATAVK
jgi:hypothetical protein